MEAKRTKSTLYIFKYVGVLSRPSLLLVTEPCWAARLSDSALGEME